MPKEENDPSKEEQTSEDGQNEGTQLEIDLNEKKAGEKAEEKEEVVTKKDLEKFQRRVEYLNRKNEQLMRKLEENYQRDSQREVQQVQQENHREKQNSEPDDLDQLALKDWKLAVRKLAEEEAERKFNQKQEEEKKLSKSKELYDSLERSKRKVLDKYPNILNEDSEEGRLMIEVYNEQPDLLRNERGPELAMLAMEEKMRATGKEPPHERARIEEEIEKEAQRRLRIGTSTIPQGVSGASSQNNKITLSQEQVNIAKQIGVPISVYAKMVKEGERGFKEGVTVNDRQDQ